MPKSIFVPIKTDRLIIDEFKTSDFHRLQEIAFNINHNADVKATEGYCPFYTFQVDRDTPQRDNVIRNKVSDFLIKAERERRQDPRSTYRMAVRLPNDKLIGNVTIDMLPIEENGKRYTAIWVISSTPDTANTVMRRKPCGDWFIISSKLTESWTLRLIRPTSFPANLLNASAANRSVITRRPITDTENRALFLKCTRKTFTALRRLIKNVRAFCRINKPPKKFKIMFSDANLPEPLLISEIENPVRLVEIRQEDGIFFNSRFTDIRLVRAYIYDLLKKLPETCRRVIILSFTKLTAPCRHK